METQTEQKAKTGQVMREAAPLVRVEPAVGRDLDALEQIERRADVMERLRERAFRGSLPEHWVDEGGKPYLMAAGAAWFARVFALSLIDISFTEQKHSDAVGNYFEFIFRCTITMPDGSRDEGTIGSCTSRDPMLGTGGTKTIEQVDPGDLRKKAQTNLKGRAIRQFLGLDNLTWETLGKYGISSDGKPRVEFKIGAKGGGQSSSSGFTFAFGKNKGKSPSDPTVAESDLQWYRKAFTESMADPGKAKFKVANEKGVAAIDAELARRTNAAAGAAAPDAKKPTIWVRLQERADAHGVPQAELGAIVKRATGGKSNANQLDESDFAKVEAELQKAAGPDDIPF